MKALGLVWMFLLLTPQALFNYVFGVTDPHTGQHGAIELGRATGPIQVVWDSEDIPTPVIILLGIIIMIAIAYYIYTKSQENQISEKPINRPLHT